MHLALAALVALAAASSPEKQGEELARRSMREYDLDQFEASLKDAQAAYLLDPRPGLLFNLGQCYRALGQWKMAERMYRNYLRAVPETPNRPLVEKCIAEVVAKQQAEAAPPASPTVVLGAPAPAPILVESAPPAAVTAPAPGRRIPGAAWWLGGGGLGVGVVGTVLFALAEGTLGGDHTQVQNGNTVHSLPASTFYPAATEGNVGEVLWAVGGALLVAGGVVAFTGGR